MSPSTAIGTDLPDSGLAGLSDKESYALAKSYDKFTAIAVIRRSKLYGKNVPSGAVRCAVLKMVSISSYRS